MAKASDIATAAREFCLWYDRYQTEFARERLKKDLGRVIKEQPKSMMSAYEHMIAAYEALHIAATGRPRPNYVDVARGQPVRAI